MNITDQKLITERYLRVKEKELEALTKKIDKLQIFKEKGIDIIRKIEKKFQNFYNSKSPKSKL